MTSKQSIVITAYGQDQPGILAELTELIAESRADIVDANLAVIRNRFVLTIIAKVSISAAKLKALQQKLQASAEKMGFKVDIESLRYLPLGGRRGNIIVVAYGHQPDALGKISSVIARISRTITSNEGNILGLGLEVNDQRPEFSLMLLAEIPSYTWDFTGLKDQLSGLEPGIEIAIQHEKVFRYMQRIDTE